MYAKNPLYCFDTTRAQRVCSRAENSAICKRSATTISPLFSFNSSSALAGFGVGAGLTFVSRLVGRHILGSSF